MNIYLPDEPTKVCLVFSVFNETIHIFVSFKFCNLYTFYLCFIYSPWKSSVWPKVLLFISICSPCGGKKPQTIKETSRTTTSLKFVPMPVLMAKWLPHSNKVPSLNFLFVWDLRGLSLARWVNWWFQAECVYVRVCCCLSVLSLL